MPRESFPSASSINIPEREGSGPYFNLQRIAERVLLAVTLVLAADSARGQSNELPDYRPGQERIGEMSRILERERRQRQGAHPFNQLPIEQWKEKAAVWAELGPQEKGLKVVIHGSGISEIVLGKRQKVPTDDTSGGEYVLPEVKDGKFKLTLPKAMGIQVECDVSTVDSEEVVFGVFIDTTLPPEERVFCLTRALEQPAQAGQ